MRTRAFFASLCAGHAFLLLSLIPGALVAGSEAGASPQGAGTGGEAQTQRKDDGYRGIWFTLGQMSEYGDKYSGGLGTYTAKHVPTAVYSAKARKTFFVYGGAKEGKRHLLAMVSYYDHERRVVPRPTIVCDKGGVNDPHDNASIALDAEGHVWVFVSGRARKRPGFKYRSVRPYDIDRFELVSEEEFTYPQPWWVEGRGFLFLFTRYTKGRELYWSRSADGREWTEARKLAGMGGHYQVSANAGGRVLTAFNWHPGGNVDRRTNLYFAETRDLGETWTTVEGKPLDLPLLETASPALVRDFEAEGRLIYLKDIGADAEGKPVILVVTSASWEPGPKGDPRIWTLLRWTGERWDLSEVTRSDHNYDMGSLWIEPGEPWRIVAPTEPGPQPWGTGGEMVLWASADRGGTWRKVRDLTRGSALNHTYARRPVGARPDFWTFWADGNPEAFSPSRLYFATRDGEVWRLPYDMTGESAEPERVSVRASAPGGGGVLPPSSVPARPHEALCRHEQTRSTIPEHTPFESPNRGCPSTSAVSWPSPHASPVSSPPCQTPALGADERNCSGSARA